MKTCPRLTTFLLASTIAAGLMPLVAPAADALWVNSYNVVWNSPSKDSLDSMPLSGRFGAGANVWVQDGSLWLYVAHNAAYDEQGRLLKLGCVRITPADKSLRDPIHFRQELDLATGTVRIRAGNFGASLWFAGQTLMVETTSATPQSLQVEFATWRDQERSGLKLDVWGTERVEPDHISTDAGGITWWHRNRDFPSDLGEAAKQQGIPREALHDPTQGLVFGGAVAAAGGLAPSGVAAVHWQYWDGKAWTAHTVKSDRHSLAIALRAQRDGNAAGWLKEATSALAPATMAAAKKDEAVRWAAFWRRSYVVVNPGAPPNDPGWQVGRNYQLFRYMLACNRGGALPLLFNGGIFTTDDPPGRIADNNDADLKISPGAPSTPDFRRWLGCRFMSQNQRWLGWPALAAGDADLLAPSVAFYRDRAGVAAARARNLGAAGVVYPEPLDVWGLCCVSPRRDGLCGAEHLTYDFDMMLQFAWMALQGNLVLGGGLRADIPWIEGTVRFYDTFYRAECKKRTGGELGADGKLVLYPCNGLEHHPRRHESGGDHCRPAADRGCLAGVAGRSSGVQVARRTGGNSSPAAGFAHRRARRQTFAAGGQVVRSRDEQMGVAGAVRGMALPIGRRHTAEHADLGSGYLEHHTRRPRAFVQAGSVVDADAGGYGRVGLGAGSATPRHRKTFRPQSSSPLPGLLWSRP